MNDQVKKYAVLKLDCIQYNTEVLSVFLEYRDALTYLKRITDQLETNIWCTILLEHDDTIAVYDTYYFTSKTLQTKLQIRCYIDSN